VKLRNNLKSYGDKIKTYGMLLNTVVCKYAWTVHTSAEQKGFVESEYCCVLFLCAISQCEQYSRHYV